MKAIRTYWLPQTNHKPRRIVATTGERGQRFVISDSKLPTSHHTRSGSAVQHGHVARMLAAKYGWNGELIGGGFPDGSMVWVFADSPDKVQVKW